MIYSLFHETHILELGTTSFSKLQRACFPPPHHQQYTLSLAPASPFLDTGDSCLAIVGGFKHVKASQYPSKEQFI